MQARHVQIEGPDFITGYVVVSGVVTEATPALSHFIGWRDSRAKAYARREGWRIRPASDGSPPQQWWLGCKGIPPSFGEVA